MLAQDFQSGSSGATVILFIISIGWFVFVIWWMLGMRTDTQRIRQTLEHRVYDFDQDEEGDSGPDDIEQLSRLGKLHQEGVLTDEEFQKIKEGLLGG